MGLGSLLSGGLSDIVNSVGHVIDTVHTSEDEKEKNNL